MTEKERFPHGIDIGLAAEINFIIGKFLELPDEKKRELARTILDNPTDSKPFAVAGIEVFQLILDADKEEVTKFMNGVHCDGDDVFTLYLIAGSYQSKAYSCTHYFRDNLVLSDENCTIQTLEL